MCPVYWADLHNHNAIGYGKGTLERSYSIARSSLDIYAFSPHGYWPDPPASDPKMPAPSSSESEPPASHKAAPCFVRKVGR